MKNCHAVIAIQIYVVIANIFQITKSEFFTSVAEMEKLLHTEEEISNTLKSYLKVEEERIQNLKRISKQYEHLLNTAKKSSEQFLSNPVNAFVLVKHLTKDWGDAMHLMEGSESKNFLYNIAYQQLSFPNEEDLSGAATALLRLQQIYLLDTATIARGQIKGAHLRSELTASDCFELGKHAYNAEYWNYTLMWMQESLNRLEKEEIKSINKIEAMEYIAYTAYDVGNFPLGLATIEKIVNLYPEYPRVFDNLDYYRVKRLEWQNKDPNEQVKEDPTKFLMINGSYWPESRIKNAYEKLCRGESTKTLKEESQLHCHYTTNNNSYLLLQPAKVEVINIKPRIVLFHDVISDTESKIVKEIATPKLQRAIVQDTITGKEEPSSDRISKSTLLRKDEHEVLTKINRRIEDITGLSTETSEPLHVINYGIGGHYDPHFDFAQIPSGIEMFRRLGNRIATWIFYLSDVPAGGSTVFPIIGAKVNPVKGAAGFWYNLYKNGAGDKRTLHAACPVLAGSKWVANKWMHQLEQEFRRLCSIDPME